MQHYFNVDEFNVQSRGLKYSESKALILVGEKTRIYQHYRQIHPSMKGGIVTR